MAVTIVIEDGTGVVDANSWITLQEARDYAASRGITLPSDDDQTGAMLVLAGDYLNSFRDRYKGNQTYKQLPMVWPRYGAAVEGELLDDNEIPVLLKRAQCEAVMAVSQGVVLLPNHVGSDLPVIREKVGPLETQYADPYAGTTGFSDWSKPNVPGVMAQLKPLLSGMTGLRVRRI